MGRRDDKKDQKRARIVAAAAALFAKQGFDATTTRQIAEKARIAAGTLFLYAPTKTDIVMMVFEDTIGRALEEAIATLPAPAGPDGRAVTAQLLHLYRAFFAVYEDNPRLARVFVKELLWLEGDSRDKRRALEAELFGVIGRIVAEAQQRGALGARVDPFLFAASTFSLYFAALAGWLSGEVPSAADALSLLERALDLLVHGALPATEPPEPTERGTLHLPRGA